MTGESVFEKAGLERMPVPFIKALRLVFVSHKNISRTGMVGRVTDINTLQRKITEHPFLDNCIIGLKFLIRV